MTDERIIRTTVKFPAPLLERAMIRAIKDQTTLHNLMIEALKAYLKEGRQ